MNRRDRHAYRLGSAFRFGAIVAAVFLACACTVQLQPSPALDPPQPSQQAETTVLPPKTVVVTPPPVEVTPQAPSWHGTHDCSVLADNGLTLEEVNSYWAALGYPSNMDNENDGIPCETIYGERNTPTTNTTSPWWGTTDCSVLADNGLTFDEVNSYWAALGYPSNMDNENDGIPCETIYGEQN